MKLIQLGGHQSKIKGYAIVDDNIFKYLNKYNWSFSNNGYAYREEFFYLNGLRKKKRILMHREIMKTPKGLSTDHINRNKLDNRVKNLRICNQSQNTINSTKKMNNTSGYKGVYWNTNLKYWVAEIKKDRKRFSLGYYKDIKDAVLAYNNKAKELFGEFAYINTI